MELTERRIRKFFPKDHRFIHFCAKRFNLSFYNEEVVELAHFHSALNLTRYLDKHGRVFENESKMVAVVMGSIRYGIMTAITERGRREKLKYKRSVDTITEADLILSGDDYSTKYDRAIATHDQPKDNLFMLVKHFKAEADPVECLVFDEHMQEGYTLKEISLEHGIPERELLNAKLRTRTKFKNLIKDEQRKLHDAQDINNHETEVRPIGEDVQEEYGYRCLVEEQRKERSLSETMSFLYSKDEVRNEDYHPWLDGE